MTTTMKARFNANYEQSCSEGRVENRICVMVFSCCFVKKSLPAEYFDLFSFLSSNMDNCLRSIYIPRVEPNLARVIPVHSMVAVAILCRLCYYSCKVWRYKHWCIANSYFFTFVCSLHAFNSKINRR